MSVSAHLKFDDNNSFPTTDRIFRLSVFFNGRGRYYASFSRESPKQSTGKEGAETREQKAETDYTTK